MSSDSSQSDHVSIIQTGHFVDDVLGDYHDRPRPKHEPDLPATEVQVKERGTDWERNRYVGRSDPTQTSYYEVSIEEPLSTPI